MTMTDSAAQDEALRRLIEMAGIDGKPEDLRALLAGINASPIADRPDRWMALVAPDADPTLAEQFDQVRRALAMTAKAVPDRAERLAPSGRSWRVRGWLALSSPGPTNIRANQCRPMPNDWHG